MRPIRNSAKAIIIEDGHILTIKKQDEQGYYYILPGGGQEPGETLVEAVRRECREELGADVDVGDLSLLREYIGKRHDHEFSERDADFHAIEFMFICSLLAGSALGGGTTPDDGQVGVEWLPLARLEAYRFYPLALRPVLVAYQGAERVHGQNLIYLGDIN